LKLLFDGWDPQLVRVMMTSAPALTAALELIQTDARLVQLKQQTQVRRS
jgi:hypothetical protein